MSSGGFKRGSGILDDNVNNINTLDVHYSNRNVRSYCTNVHFLSELDARLLTGISVNEVQDSGAFQKYSGSD